MYIFFILEKGEIFGWGNSEYSQLSIVAPDESQVNVARHLPFSQVGKVTKVAAGGSTCAVISGKCYIRRMVFLKQYITHANSNKSANS